MRQAKASVRSRAQQGDSGEDKAVAPQSLMVQHIEVQLRYRVRLIHIQPQPVINILRYIV